MLVPSVKFGKAIPDFLVQLSPSSLHFIEQLSNSKKREQYFFRNTACPAGSIIIHLISGQFKNEGLCYTWLVCFLSKLIKQVEERYTGLLINPNKTGLFEGSFFGGRREVNLTPSSYFKKSYSNINITLYNF